MKNEFKELEDIIEVAYSEGVTLEQAERLAAKFLHAQLQVSSQLEALDLDARMRKSGLKAIRAAVLLQEVQSHDKKPADSMLAAIVDSNSIVETEQRGLDEAEVRRDALERNYDIFNNAHIYFRGVAKGNFGG